MFPNERSKGTSRSVLGRARLRAPRDVVIETWDEHRVDIAVGYVVRDLHDEANGWKLVFVKRINVVGGTGRLKGGGVIMRILVLATSVSVR